MKSIIRSILDDRLPSIMRSYRYLRDYLNYITSKSHATSMGFSLWGSQHDATKSSSSWDVVVFQDILKSSDVVVDVGANIGLFTCLAVKAGKQVVAIEPHPFNFSSFVKTLQINDFLGRDIEVFPIALSDRPGVSFLHGGGQGASLLEKWGGIGATSTYESPIATSTLDRILGCCIVEGSRMLIKVDVEGNEFNVLRGASHTLQRNPAPIWIVEHGLTKNFNSSINPNFQELFELFWQNDYSAYTVDAETRPVTVSDIERWISCGKRDFGTIDFLFKHN